MKLRRARAWRGARRRGRQQQQQQQQRRRRRRQQIERSWYDYPRLLKTKREKKEKRSNRPDCSSAAALTDMPRTARCFPGIRGGVAARRLRMRT